MPKIERQLAGIENATARRDAPRWVVRRVAPERVDPRIEAADNLVCRPALLQWRDRLRQDDRPSPYRITRLR